MSLYFHSDDDGKEWGPFTRAQLTSLLNKGCLTAKSLIRLSEDQTWYTYYKVPDSKTQITGDINAIIEHGKRVAAELELHLAKRLIAQSSTDTAMPPIDVDIRFCEEYGLAYSEYFTHESGMTGLELVFIGTDYITVHIYLPDKDQVCEELGGEKEELAKYLLLRVHEACHKMVAAKTFVSSGVSEPMAIAIETPFENFTLYLFQYDRVQPYKNGSREFFREIETVAYVNDRLIRVAYSFPRFAETVHGNKMLEFAVTAVLRMAGK